MSQTISIASRPKGQEDVRWRRDGEADQIIVLSREGLALPLLLNLTAARIFQLCDGKNTVEDIANVLCEEFGMPDFSRVLEDVRSQIEYFKGKGVLKDV